MLLSDQNITASEKGVEKTIVNILAGKEEHIKQQKVAVNENFE